MLKVKEIMTKELITISPDTEIPQVARMLLEKRINGIPVVDESGGLIGIVCQSDLIAQQKELPVPSYFTFLDGLILLTSMKQIEKEVQKVTATKVAEVMTHAPEHVSPETGIDTVATLMVEKKFHTLPVVEDGKLVGIVGKEDVLRTLME